MTVQEAAILLEVSPDLVYRLCRDGRLAHVRIGSTHGKGAIRIDKVDVEAFKAGERIEAGEPTRQSVSRPAPRRGEATDPYSRAIAKLNAVLAEKS